MTISSKSKSQFARLPWRAVGDQRLGARHYRVLAVIAYHDRTDKGCFASHGTLHKEACCDYAGLSRLIADLNEWHYVSIGKDPYNGRLRVYRIMSDDEAHAAAKVGSPANNHSGSEIVGSPANNEPSIVGLPQTQATDIEREFAANILSEAKRNKRKTSLSVDAEEKIERQLEELRQASLQSTMLLPIKGGLVTEADLQESGRRLGGMLRRA